MCKWKKILGHIATGNKSTSETIDGRVKKAKFARRGIRNTRITHREIDTNLRLQLFVAIIGSILLYSLHIILINKTDKYHKKITNVNYIEIYELGRNDFTFFQN